MKASRQRFLARLKATAVQAGIPAYVIMCGYKYYQAGAPTAEWLLSLFTSAIEVLAWIPVWAVMMHVVSEVCANDPVEESGDSDRPERASPDGRDQGETK